MSKSAFKTALGNNQNQQQKADSLPVQQINKKRGIQIQQRSIPTTQHFSNQGIPPDIYGMYHVRKGTHKWTNK